MQLKIKNNVAYCYRKDITRLPLFMRCNVLQIAPLKMAFRASIQPKEDIFLSVSPRNTDTSQEAEG